MEFGILGPTEMIVDGAAVPIGPAKQRGMLAVLLYHVGEPVRADRMIQLLWDPPNNADHRPTLYSIASRLRGVLGSVGLGKALTRVAGVGAYRLDLDAEAIDFHHLRRVVREARGCFDAGNPRAAADMLVQGLALRRGEPLAELRGPRAEEIRSWVNEALVEGHRLLAETLLACGQSQTALARLEPAMREHELDESLARFRIQALLQLGRKDEAKTFAIGFQRRYRKEMRTNPDIDVAVDAVRASVRPVVRSVPRHLPPDIADFTGRLDLLDQLDEMRSTRLKPDNIVVITGMAGVGKTTLATHWAHRQRRHFPDGQLYLDAGAYGDAEPVDPNEALGRFLLTLGSRPDQLPATLEQRRDRFEDLIGDRRILVFIDNVRGSTQVRPLIPRSMNCLTIITSRVRLGGLTIRDGIRTITTTPMTEDESVELLARIVRRPEGRDDEMMPLARLSGGLPLAVRIIGEHVAERPRTSFRELTEELRDRLVQSADEDDRAASLDTVFAWSYHALGSEEARIFRRVALHPGTTVSAESAAALLGISARTTETVLNALAKAHMISHDASRRYRYHDLLRRYAIEQAAREDGPGCEPEEQRRLLDWYLLSAANAVAVMAPEWPAMPDLPEPRGIEPAPFATEAQAMGWYEAEKDNLRAAARWAAAQGFHRHGWQIPGVAYEFLERCGAPADLVRLNREALAAARDDGHEVGQIGTLANLGATYFAMHDFEKAVPVLMEAQQLAMVTGHSEEEAACSHNLASAYLNLGQVERAVGIYRETLEMCRRLANPAGESAVLYWLGQAYLLLGDHQRSAGTQLQALAIREKIGAKRGVGQSYSGLAALCLATGELRSALSHADHAMKIHLSARDLRAQCGTLIILSDIQRGLCLFTEAVRDGRRAVLLSDDLSDPYLKVGALTSLSDALAASGDPAGAGEQIRAARRVLDGLTGSPARKLRERLLAVEKDTLGAPGGLRAAH
ncbi:SARP family transcriptional regulator [Actinoplanes sp. NBRC 14428]|nr:SARP family transcriptional regulator [Actinoplanes sp. NBRC 14428]